MRKSTNEKAEVLWARAFLVLIKSNRSGKTGILSRFAQHLAVQLTSKTLLIGMLKRFAAAVW
jgi:hypothetical protein